MKRKDTKNQNPTKDTTVYCAECGTILDDFCFSSDATNIEAVKINHENCKKINKFKGDYCSRLFIAENVDQDDIDD